VRELPPERLRYILLHELAHLKRHDILTGWILAFLQAMHWFNPLIWWAFGRIRSDRELACDEQALSNVPDAERRHYGDVLIGMLERYNHNYRLPAIAGILENKKQLKRRMVMIKKFRRPARREIIAFAALLAALSIALLTEPRTLLSQSTADAAVRQKGGINVATGAEDAWPPGLFDDNIIFKGSGKMTVGINETTDRIVMFNSGETGGDMDDEIAQLLSELKEGTKEGEIANNPGVTEYIRMSDGTMVAENGTVIKPGDKIILLDRIRNAKWQDGTVIMDIQPVSPEFATQGMVSDSESGGSETQQSLSVYPVLLRFANSTPGSPDTAIFQPPNILERPIPNYTEEARDARVEGIVVLLVTIDKDGSVNNARVTQGLGYGLDESAIRTVTKQWRFSPATRDGIPVDHFATIEVSFHLF
jgi:TonB family protein